MDKEPGGRRDRSEYTEKESRPAKHTKTWSGTSKLMFFDGCRLQRFDVLPSHNWRSVL